MPKSTVAPLDGEASFIPRCTCDILLCVMNMHGSSTPLRTVTRALLLLSTLVFVACDPGPVDWRETRELGAAPPPESRLVVEDFSLPRFESEPRPDAPPPANACPGSLNYARMDGTQWHRVWWQPQPDGRAALFTARSPDAGATWDAPILVDSSDRARTGCDRLPPAVAADSLTRFVHVVFYMRAPNGDGVWYAHSMDDGATWHGQAGLIYGDDPARADVAAEGELVVVGYENPNAAEQAIGLAISRDGGHTFLPRLTVTSGSGAASAPRVGARRPGFGVAWKVRNGWLARVGVMRE